MSLLYPASTQACAAIVVAFHALHVCEETLRKLVAEWTQMGIPQVPFNLLSILSQPLAVHTVCTLSQHDQTHAC